MRKMGKKRRITVRLKKEKIETSELIELMGIYLSEWEHRDTLFWSQIFKFFYAILIFILFPYLLEGLGVSDDVLLKVPVRMFPMIGIVLSFIFLYVGLAYSARLVAINKSYINLIALLPQNNIKRLKVTDPRILSKDNCSSSSLHSRRGANQYSQSSQLKIKVLELFKPRVSVMMTWIMFFILLFIAIYLLSLEKNILPPNVLPKILC